MISLADAGTETTMASLDRALVERAADADHEAFEALVRRRADSAYRTALAILRDPSDAADATQEALLRAWRELPRLRDPGRFEAWFMRILVNSCRNTMRGNRRRTLREIPTEVAAIGSDLLPDRSIAVDDQAASRDRVGRAFLRLGHDERMLLALHHAEARPVTELARITGWPEGTVKWRLSRARQALARALDEEDR
jgi:RNA polymerase sigma-70 factor (ECF subfamily)